MAAGIGLSELIGAVKQEIQKSIELNDGAIEFEVRNVKLELEVGVETVSQGRGAVRILVLEAGGDRSWTKGTTQRITVELGAPLSGSSGWAQVPVKVARELPPT